MPTAILNPTSTGTAQRAGMIYLARSFGTQSLTVCVCVRALFFPVTSRCTCVLFLSSCWGALPRRHAPPPRTSPSCLLYLAVVVKLTFVRPRSSCGQGSCGSIPCVVVSVCVPLCWRLLFLVLFKSLRCLSFHVSFCVRLVFPMALKAVRLSLFVCVLAYLLLPFLPLPRRSPPL